MTASFDTLSAARNIERADRDAAEAIAGAIRMGQGDQATKADLAELEQRLRRETAKIRNDLLWMKRIGGVIVALLAVPVLNDLPEALGSG